MMVVLREKRVAKVRAVGGAEPGADPDRSEGTTSILPTESLPGIPLILYFGCWISLCGRYHAGDLQCDITLEY